MQVVTACPVHVLCLLQTMAADDLLPSLIVLSSAFTTHSLHLSHRTCHPRKLA